MNKEVLVIVLALVVLYCSCVVAQGSNCTSSCRSACAVRTTQNLVVKAYNALVQAQTPGQLMTVWNDITNSWTYSAPGGFHVFVLDWSDHVKAWGGNRTSWVGLELKGVAAWNGAVTNLNLGSILRAAANTTGGSWTKFQWADAPGAPVLPHRAFLRHFNMFLTDYYVGVAYTDLDCSLVNTACSRSCVSPCAVENTKNIVDNLVFDMINACNTRELEVILDNVNSGAKYTVQSGFYSFVNLYTGPTVANGLHPEYVGLTLPEIADQLGFYNAVPMNLHDQFIQVANTGGGWLSYPWSDVGPALSETYAYVAPATSVGTAYYVAAAFVNVPCPMCSCNCNCPTQYCDKCYEPEEEVTSQITFKFQNLACVGDKC